MDDMKTLAHKGPRGPISLKSVIALSKFPHTLNARNA